MAFDPKIRAYFPPLSPMDPAPEILAKVYEIIQPDEVAQIAVAAIDMKIAQSRAYINALEAQKEILSKKINIR